METKKEKKERKEKKKARKRSFKNSEKIHPKPAIICTILLGISLFTLIFLCIQASLKEEGGGLFFGFIGIVIMIVSLVGMIVSSKTFRKKEIYYHFPMVGTLGNGILFIICLLIYLTGIII